ncbi:MAG TPA: hypothetical protein VNE39_27980, partial [Planctomycetota bacterium]|nr:hypothetical protein [Planctomycetota bacterium]
DEVVHIETRDAKWAARMLALREGIFAGISSGAALRAALDVGAREENRGKLVVVILPDTGERYLTTDAFSWNPRSLSAVAPPGTVQALERAQAR